MTVMTDASAETSAQGQISPEHWMMLWCMEHSGSDPEAIRRAAGLSEAQLAELRSSHPQVCEEISSLHRLGSYLSLEMLFVLIRQKIARMLAVATKPSELRSLLGSVRQLPGAKELLQQGGRSVPPGDEKGTDAHEGTAALLAQATDKLSRQQRRQLERKLRKAVAAG